MTCPNCGGETGAPTSDDPRPPAHGGHDPPPQAVFCSAECVDEFDIDKVPSTWAITISGP